MSSSGRSGPSQAVREHRAAAPRLVGCAVVTISDTRTAADDKSGRLAREALEGAGHRVARYEIVPDEARLIKALLDGLLAETDLDAIVTTGGTGISPRDTTYEVLNAYVERPLPGFGELFRALSFEQIGAAAMLSRAIAGIVGDKILFALPGSSGAVALALERLIVPELGHIVGLLRKDAHGS